jgi:hypothetical protein
LINRQTTNQGEITMDDQMKMELCKVREELAYLRSTVCDLDTFKEVVKIAKDNSLQRVNWGNVSFEMPYNPQPAGANIAPSVS